MRKGGFNMTGLCRKKKAWTLELGDLSPSPDCHQLVLCLSFPHCKMTGSGVLFSGVLSEGCICEQQEARVSIRAGAWQEQRPRLHPAP